MDWRQTKFYVILCLTGSVMSVTAACGESVAASEARRHAIIAAATRYLHARTTGHIGALQKAIAFPDGFDQEGFWAKLRSFPPQLTWERVDLHEEIFLVSPADSSASGDYVFLVPTRVGYLPRVLPMVVKGDECRVEYKSSEFPLPFDAGPSLNATQLTRRTVEKKLQAWRSYVGEDLVRAVKEHREELQRQLLALEYAALHNIHTMEGFGTADARRQLLDSTEHLSPEEFRDKVVHRCKQILARLAQSSRESRAIPGKDTDLPADRGSSESVEGTDGPPDVSKPAIGRTGGSGAGPVEARAAMPEVVRARPYVIHSFAAGAAVVGAVGMWFLFRRRAA